MPQNIFLKRKQDIFSKQDKSSRQHVDEKIAGLCEKINQKENYYTTSSCSGRVILIIESDKKEHGLFVKIYHDLISFEQLKKDLKNIKNKKTISFKQEPCGLHVACRTLKDAQQFLDKAKFAGWKKSGIIASNKRFVVECFSTEKLEFPIISNGKILVNDDFLKLIVKKSNENLRRSWNKIEKLRRLI